MMKKIIIGILLVLIVFFAGCKSKSKEIEVKIVGHETKEVLIDEKLETNYYIKAEYEEVIYLVKVEYKPTLFNRKSFEETYPLEKIITTYEEDLIEVG